ncbi:Bud site selection protein 6 [Smittium culicis]|uniref:Bud site selection protein 6 n=1 Tax=Smittium culicis TaxID=133412 RepID=A0A1R1X9Y3_9FUNG|nr:Bud site selection protein 6 [Smittium culicis]
MKSLQGFLALPNKDDLDFNQNHQNSLSKAHFRLQRKPKLKTGGESRVRSPSPSKPRIKDIRVSRYSLDPKTLHLHQQNNTPQAIINNRSSSRSKDQYSSKNIPIENMLQSRTNSSTPDPLNVIPNFSTRSESAKPRKFLKSAISRSAQMILPFNPTDKEVPQIPKEFLSTTNIQSIDDKNQNIQQIQHDNSVSTSDFVTANDYVTNNNPPTLPSISNNNESQPKEQPSSYHISNSSTEETSDKYQNKPPINSALYNNRNTSDNPLEHDLYEDNAKTIVSTPTYLDTKTIPKNQLFSPSTLSNKISVRKPKISKSNTINHTPLLSHKSTHSLNEIYSKRSSFNQTPNPHSHSARLPTLPDKKSIYYSDKQLEGGEDSLSPSAIIKRNSAIIQAELQFNPIYNGNTSNTTKSVSNTRSNSSSPDLSPPKSPLSKINSTGITKLNYAPSKATIHQVRDAVVINMPSKNGTPFYFTHPTFLFTFLYQITFFIKPNSILLYYSIFKESFNSVIETSPVKPRKSRSYTTDSYDNNKKKNSTETLVTYKSPSDFSEKSRNKNIDNDNDSTAESYSSPTISKFTTTNPSSNPLNTTLFLQYGERIRKSNHVGQPSIFSLITLFLDTFIEDQTVFSEISTTDLNAHQSTPLFLIKDHLTGVFFELVNLDEVRERSLIKWNVSPIISPIADSKTLDPKSNINIDSPTENIQSDITATNESYADISKKLSGLPNLLETIVNKSISNLSEIIKDQLTLNYTDSVVFNSAKQKTENDIFNKEKLIDSINSLTDENLKLKEIVTSLKEKVSNIDNQLKISKSEKLLLAQKNTDLSEQLKQKNYKISTLESKIKELETPLPASTSEKSNARKRLELEKSQLKSRYEDLGIKMEDLEILVNELRKDVVIRKSTPTQKLISKAETGLDCVLTEAESLKGFFNEIMPKWKGVWSDELKEIVSEQHFSNQIDSELNDLTNDAKSLLDILSKLNAVVELKQEGSNASSPRSPNMKRISDSVKVINISKLNSGSSENFVDPSDNSGETLDFKKQLFNEISLLEINSDERVEAIEISEKVRKFELDSRSSNEFQSELSNFVTEKKLKPTGGIDELELKLQARMANNLINSLSN